MEKKGLRADGNKQGMATPVYHSYSLFNERVFSPCPNCRVVPSRDHVTSSRDSNATVDPVCYKTVETRPMLPKRSRHGLRDGYVGVLGRSYGTELITLRSVRLE